MTADPVTASAAPAAEALAPESEALSSLSASVAEAGSAGEDQQQLDATDSSQTVADDDTQPVPADSPVTDDDSMYSDAVTTFSHDGDVDVDDGRRDDEEQQLLQPVPADETPSLIASDDKPVDSSDNMDESMPADETVEASATTTAANDDDDITTDEPIQPSLTQPKPELKYQYSEGLCEWYSFHTQYNRIIGCLS